MASTKITRTSSASSEKKLTISYWLKRSTTGEESVIGNTNDGSNWAMFYFNGANKLQFASYVGGSYVMRYTTNRTFSDVGAWYHLVATVDVSLASPEVKVYVNGEEQTSLQYNVTPSQNADIGWFNAWNFEIGVQFGSSYYLNGSLAHLYYIQGYIHPASTFGETDSTSGIWKAKSSASVTYGNNGFFLKFENSGAMGTDSSGNSNTFTVNGTLTQNVDTPNNNFATLNPLPSQKIGTDCFYEYGNTNVRSSSANFRAGVSGIYVNKGKWYFEMQQSNADCHMGIAGENKIQNGGTSGGVNNRLFYYEDTTGYAYSYNAGNGMIYFSTPSDGTQTASYGNAFGSSDTVGCFADLDNNKLYFSKNGTIQNSGTGYTIQGDIYYALGSSIYNGDTSLNYGNGSFKGVKLTGTTFADANGQGIFKYSPNQGGASNFDSAAKNFYTLNTKNLKEFG